MSYASEVGGDISTFDGRVQSTTWEAMLAPFINYLTTSSLVKDIYTALHVEGSTKTQIFSF